MFEHFPIWIFVSFLDTNILEYSFLSFLYMNIFVWFFMIQIYSDIRSYEKFYVRHPLIFIKCIIIFEIGPRVHYRNQNRFREHLVGQITSPVSTILVRFFYPGFSLCFSSFFAFFVFLLHCFSS